MWITINPFFQCSSAENIHPHFDGLVQDCSNSSALAMELLQTGTTGTKPSIYTII